MFFMNISMYFGNGMWEKFPDGLILQNGVKMVPNMKIGLKNQLMILRTTTFKLSKNALKEKKDAANEIDSR